MIWKTLFCSLLALGTVCLAQGDRLNAQTPTDDSGTLRARLERRFEVFPLRDGALLRPHRNSASRSRCSSGS